MTTKIGINGFGRVGRQVLRLALKSSPTIQVVAINDPFMDATAVAHAIKRDSTHGVFDGPVEAKSKDLIYCHGHQIHITGHMDPSMIPWSDFGVAYVIEASGVYTTAERAAGHLAGGAQRILIATLSADAPLMIMGHGPGVGRSGVAMHFASASAASSTPPNASSSTYSSSNNNEGAQGGLHDQASLVASAWASAPSSFLPQTHQVFCVGNSTGMALVPILSLLSLAFGVKDAMFTDIHSVTTQHHALDGGGGGGSAGGGGGGGGRLDGGGGTTHCSVPDSALRMTRGISNNIAPMSAADTLRTVAKVLGQSFAHRIGGIAVRVPTSDVCMLDLTVTFERPTTKAAVDAVFEAAAAQSSTHQHYRHQQYFNSNNNNTHQQQEYQHQDGGGTTNSIEAQHHLPTADRNPVAQGAVAGYTRDPVVSTDFIGSRHSFTYDAVASVALSSTGADSTPSTFVSSTGTTTAVGSSSATEDSPSSSSSGSDSSAASGSGSEQQQEGMMTYTHKFSTTTHNKAGAKLSSTFKLVFWYDNETAAAARVLDLVAQTATHW